MHLRGNGFTIIELIVVIVAIAVLASMSVFGYSSWRLRTARTEVKNELMNASLALQQNVNLTNTYPASNSLASIYTPRAAVSLTYTLRTGGESYCLIGQSMKISSVTYYVDSTKGNEPITTVCS